MDGGTGLARFRVMMSDGRHTMSCKLVSFNVRWITDSVICGTSYCKLLLLDVTDI